MVSTILKLVYLRLLGGPFGAIGLLLLIADGTIGVALARASC